MPENLMQNRREAGFRKPFCYPQKTFGERPVHQNTSFLSL